MKRLSLSLLILLTLGAGSEARAGDPVLATAEVQMGSHLGTSAEGMALGAELELMGTSNGDTYGTQLSLGLVTGEQDTELANARLHLIVPTGPTILASSGADLRVEPEFFRVNGQIFGLPLDINRGLGRFDGLTFGALVERDSRSNDEQASALLLGTGGRAEVALSDSIFVGGDLALSLLIGELGAHMEGEAYLRAQISDSYLKVAAGGTFTTLSDEPNYGLNLGVAAGGAF
ncbi:MAG: hypothetical protein IT285_07170 [Bdellovibrionales bacterium]|nr:hypothetical protein [Bdellovibrionales bacterium]